MNNPYSDLTDDAMWHSLNYLSECQNHLRIKILCLLLVSLKQHKPAGNDILDDCNDKLHQGYLYL